MDIDHIVFAAPNLERGMAHMERLLGIMPVAGGRHPSLGTHNALLALGPTCYLEVIAPDPEQAETGGPLPFGLDSGGPPRLTAWAGRVEDIERAAATDLGGGTTLGPVMQGNRCRADGSRLEWLYTDPMSRLWDGVVPFLIDWGDARHPALDAPAGCTLATLSAAHPDPRGARAALAALGTEMAVSDAPLPALAAAIETPSGKVILR